MRRFLCWLGFHKFDYDFSLSVEFPNGFIFCGHCPVKRALTYDEFMDYF
jgi:hypothetical protein